MSGVMREQVDVRARLRRDIPWVLAAVGVLYAVLASVLVGFGWDSRAYWDAWQGGMYSGAPGAPGAYLYSPAFAQILWPLAPLPWPAFAATLSVLAGLGMGWLLKPLGARVAVPLWLASAPEIASGNVFALLGVAAVVGARYPQAWAVAALTKITPCVGPVWFACRREWGHVLRSIVAIAGVVVVSYAISPALWHQWIDFLGGHVASVGSPVGSPVIPGPLYRVPLSIALVAWGARTGRIWTVPVSMCVATPVFGFAALTMCAAVPRLAREVDGCSGGPVASPSVVCPQEHPVNSRSHDGPAESLA